MRQWLPVLALLVGAGSSISSAQATAPSSPLDQYISLVREHRIDSVATNFAADCGLKIEGVAAKYGFANDDAGIIRSVVDLPEAYDNFEMDLVGTDEVWRVGNRFFIEEWQAELDVGGYSRRLYCFDEYGRLEAVDGTNFQLPTDEGEQSWGMHERWTRKADGSFTATVPFQFIGLDEKETSRPKLDADSSDFADHWGKHAPDSITVHELKLPPELLR